RWGCWRRRWRGRGLGRWCRGGLLAAWRWRRRRRLLRNDGLFRTHVPEAHPGVEHVPVDRPLGLGCRSVVGTEVHHQRIAQLRVEVRLMQQAFNLLLPGVLHEAAEEVGHGGHRSTTARPEFL